MDEMEKKVILGNTEPKSHRADTRRQATNYHFVYHFKNGGLFPYKGEDLEIYWKNFEDEEKKVFSELTEKCNYFYYGHEICPKTKRPHLQGFLKTKKPSRISEFKKYNFLCRLNLEVQIGTDKQNDLYCSKDMFRLTEYDKSKIDTRKEINAYISKLTRDEILDILDEYRKQHKELFIISRGLYQETFKMGRYNDEWNIKGISEKGAEDLLRGDLEDILISLKIRKTHIDNLRNLV